MPKKELEVTIFVPVKNAESTIKNCIKSLLNQTYKNKKIFVIDNMSTDGTYEILQQFKNKIKLKRMKGLVPRLHNYILNHVKTEFLAYTNADCVADKNWLRNLINGFNSSDIVATAGYCGTPKGLSKLQELIGRELENRFKKFPKFISRAPDMNLCVRTSVAKKVKFDERFIWSWESDFGYRLTKLGKMKYIPEAIVYHYHRPTWKSFFKQQFNNAKISSILYWKHKDKIKGDHISTGSMGLTLFFTYLLLFFLFLSIINKIFLYPALIFFTIPILIFLKDIITLAKSLDEIPILFGIFIIRTIAWIFGTLVGLYLFFKNKWYKKQN